MLKRNATLGLKQGGVRVSDEDTRVLFEAHSKHIRIERQLNEFNAENMNSRAYKKNSPQ